MKSKFVKFITKRAAILLILSAAAALVFMGSHRWPVLAGLSAGALLSFGRLRGNEWIFGRILRPNGSKAAGSAVTFTVSQFALILILAISYSVSIWVMCGVVAGLLLIPAVVMLNSVTEAFGITKNNFE